MIPIVLGSLVNIAVLAMIFTAGTGSDAKGTIYAVLITGGLAAIALSPVGELFFRLINGCRQPIQKEEEKLRPVLEAVCQDAGLDPQNYDLFVSDDKFPNAFAVGKKTVCVTCTLLQNSSEEQLQGIIAHEMAHHVNGDARRLVVFYVLTVIAQAIATIGWAISSMFGDDVGIVGWIISLFVTVFNLFLWLPIKAGQAFGSRQEEFAADEYAIKIGHGEGLHLALSGLLPLEGKPSGFMGMIYASHPQLSVRIRRIEQKLAIFLGDQGIE